MSRFELTWLGQAASCSNRKDADSHRPWVSPHEQRLIPPPPVELVTQRIVTHQHLDQVDLGRRSWVPLPCSTQLEAIGSPLKDPLLRHVWCGRPDQGVDSAAYRGQRVGGSRAGVRGRARGRRDRANLARDGRAGRGRRRAAREGALSEAVGFANSIVAICRNSSGPPGAAKLETGRASRRGVRVSSTLKGLG
jgi:hypothetical protein